MSVCFFSGGQLGGVFEMNEAHISHVRVEKHLNRSGRIRDSMLEMRPTSP